MPEFRSWPQKLVLPLLAASYFVAGKLGLMLALVHTNATGVWPPTGIALAAFLLLGYRVWPAIFAGALLVNLTIPEGAFYSNVTSLPILAAALGIALGNTLEGLAGAWLVNRLANGPRAFESARGVILFAGLAGVASTTVSATIGGLSLCLGGLAPWANYGAIWLTWWLGDAIGALLVAPLIVLWAENPRVQRSRQWLEAGCLWLLLLLVGGGLFAGFLRLENVPLAFLSIPFLLWAALRFGPRETATANFILCGLAMWGTLRGHGPFVRMSANESLLLLQVFVAVNSVMSLAVAALVAEREQALQALRESEERLSFALQKSRIGGWGLDLVDHTAYRTLEHDRIFGYGSLLPQWTYELFLEHVLPGDRAEVDRLFREATAAQTEWNFECRIRRADGEVRWIWATGEHQRNAVGEARRMAGIVQDITGRKHVELALRASEQRLRAVLESALDAIITMDHEGRIVEFNSAAERMFGYSRSGVLGREMAELIIPPALRERHRRGLAHYVATKEGPALNQRLEFPALRRDGSEFPIELSITRVGQSEPPLFTGFIRDITERRQTEATLLASLREKEVMLKEIHHRVKNNLQVVSSLLRLQARSLKHPETAAAFEESCTRVQAMALVHEMLYDSSSFSALDFAAYVQSLTDSLLRAFGTDRAVIHFRLDMAKVHLDINQAIPCALILNELVSNSLKYAFPDGRHGEIWLRLYCDPDGTTHVVVGDNGVGLPARVNPDKTESLGLQLVNTLVRQLHGTLEIHRTDGIEYAITFMAAKSDNHKVPP